MFITVDGFNRTGIPSTVWDLMEPHARINHAKGMAVLTVVVLLLSNIASNVPTGFTHFCTAFWIYCFIKKKYLDLLATRLFFKPENFQTHNP